MEYFNVVFTACFLIGVSNWTYGRVVVNNIEATNSRTRRHTTMDNTKLCKAFGCVNGYCKDSEIRNFRIVCECFPGFEGNLCDRHKCPFDCGNHGTCARKGHILYCKCDEGYHGAKCDSYAQPITQSNAQSLVAPKSLMEALGGLVITSDGNFKPKGTVLSLSNSKSWYSLNSEPVNQIKFTDFHSHAEIDTSVKADVCAPGFQCYHGHCDRDAMAFGVFQCLCKPNFTGLFCEKRCTLNCQNDGKCMVLQDGHQFCSCPFNFTGHYCQTPLSNGLSV